MRRDPDDFTDPELSNDSISSRKSSLCNLRSPQKRYKQKTKEVHPHYSDQPPGCTAGHKANRYICTFSEHKSAFPQDQCQSRQSRSLPPIHDQLPKGPSEPWNLSHTYSVIDERDPEHKYDDWPDLIPGQLISDLFVI